MNQLNCNSRMEFRDYLEKHHDTDNEVYVICKRGKPGNEHVLYYLDAVEEALCFGWIDGGGKTVDGITWFRFSPRRKNSLWTELNKERVRRLEKLGLMTDAGRKVLPPMGPRSFRIDPDVEKALKAARVYKAFRSFPPLYQRIRAYNVAFYKVCSPDAYRKALTHLIAETKKGHIYGEWNDYGRLLNY